MSFDSHETLPKFLSSLSQIALEHTQATGLPAHFEFAVQGGAVESVAFFESDGTPVHVDEAEPPVAPAPEVQFVLAEAQATQELTEDGSYVVRSSEGGSVTAFFVAAPAPADDVEADSGDLSAVATAPNNGLALLAALKKHGNTGGYSATEIDAAAKTLGVTFSPEIRFYRSNVKDGKVAEGPHGDVQASALDAEFGASSGNDPLPTPRPTDLVQPLHSHKLWIEIAHDSAAHYAADLAPGAAGAIGQIIGRDNESTQPPQLVARSLADFVSGEWVDDETAASSWVPAAPAVEAEPVVWSLSAEDFEGQPRFIELPVEEAPVAEEVVEDDVAVAPVAEEVEEVVAEEATAVEEPAVAEAPATEVPAEPAVAPVAEETTDEPSTENDDDFVDPVTSLMTGSDISFSDVIAADELPAPVSPVIEEEEEILVAQTSDSPTPIVPVEEVETPAEMPMHPVADPAPAPVAPVEEKPQPEPQTSAADEKKPAEAKPKVSRKAKKRAQRVSFEVSSSDFSAEPAAMNDDFITLAPVIDSNDIKGLNEEEISKQSSPFTSDVEDRDALPDSIFAVNRVHHRPAPKKPSERSSQDIAQDFAAVAFGNPYDDEDDYDDFDDRRDKPGGLRGAFKRFFG